MATTTYEHLKTIPPLIACTVSTLLTLYEQSGRWAKVDLVVRDAAGGSFFVTMSVEVSLSVGEDASLPREVYTSAAKVGLVPFVTAGRVALVLLFFSFAASSLSVGMSVLHFIQKGTLGYKSQILLLITATASHFFAVVLYMIMTVGQLGVGGYYLQGLHVALVNVFISVFCVVVSFLADAIMKLEAVVALNRQRGLGGRGGSLYGATTATAATAASAYTPLPTDPASVELCNAPPPSILHPAASAAAATTTITTAVASRPTQPSPIRTASKSPTKIPKLMKR